MATADPPSLPDDPGPSGMAAGRGALLLAVAVAVGIVLLNAADKGPTPQQVAASKDSETTTSSPVAVTSSTLGAHAPKDVKVLAANATRVKGAGGKVRDTLQRAGYDVLAPTDAPKANSSIAYFVTGYERDAAEIARVLGLPVTAIAPMPTPAPVGDIRGAHVVVVIGPELAGGTGETSTTTRRTSSTTSTTRSSSATTAKPASSTTTTRRASSTTTTRRGTTTTDSPN